MTTKTIDDLQAQIERLVREHLAAQRDAATSAVERAFASASAPAKGPRACPRTARARARRRPAGEMAGLAERLYEVVRANPGETITVIAAQLRETARTLNQPMMKLKRAGRVRSAGARHLTRYFPMTSSKLA